MTEPQKPPAKGGKSGKSGQRPIDRVQFLLVDDHAFVRHIVIECLKSKGITRFASAQDGGQALHLLKTLSPKIKSASVSELIEDRPDIASDLYPDSTQFKSAHEHCVITDFKMPDTNGLQLLKAIRCGETSIPRDTPVILLTGFSEDFVVSTALQLDVNAFVLKPVSRDTLWQKIGRVLTMRAPVKLPGAYRDIEIPDDEGQPIKYGVGVVQAEGAQAEAEEEIHWMPLGAVQPGSILAQDLHGERGGLLLRAGTEFTQSVIQKLTDLQSMKGLSGQIPIKPAPPA